MKIADTAEKSLNSTDNSLETLDVSTDVCPMTFVRTKLSLEKLPAGSRLLVTVRAGEALENVPRAAASEGYVIESKTESSEVPGLWRILIRKPAH